MALIKCPECGKDISKKAGACPSCGNPIKKKTSGCAWMALIAIVAGVILAPAISKVSSQPSRAPQDPRPERDKYYTARAYVKDRLKSPSTAKFSNILTDKDTGIEKIGEGRWRAFGWVDSQNSFGAMLRSQWEIIWEDPGNKVTYLKIGDSETGSK